jgi:hypothetical protein
MTFSKVVVWWGGLGFFLFGWAYLVAPGFMVNLSGMLVPTPASVTDARAMYGGFQIGYGAFAIFCGLRPRLLPAGLLTLAMAYGGIVICRCLGFFLDPGSSGGADHYHLWAIGILELPVTVAAITALMFERRENPSLF